MLLTPNRNENIYYVAKKSTFVEAILTCNYILGFEFYGMLEKKRGFVMFGIGYRIFSVVAHVLLLIAIFGFNFLETYVSLHGGHRYRNDELIKMMKIVIGVIYSVDIAYNLFFKIGYQIKVRKLMKEEEEENSIPMTQAYPQIYYPQSHYPQSTVTYMDPWIEDPYMSQYPSANIPSKLS